MALLLSYRQQMVHASKSTLGYSGLWRRKIKYTRMLIVLLLVCIGLHTSIAGITNHEDSFSGCSSITVKEESGGSDCEPPLLVVDPNITVRFSNPTFNCNTQEYIVDVEFKSDIANQELYFMNVFFWYDDNVLELINFRNYVGGYGAGPPTPPSKYTYASLGPTWFNFPGGAEWVSGAVQLVNENLTPVIISTTAWTKLYQIAFHVDDPNANLNNFWPAVVWDKKANPANGGFITGSEGVVMTVVNPTGGALPVSEHVLQYNWQYMGNGTTPPYGQPSQVTTVSINCIPIVTCPANVTLACGASTLPASTGTASATDFCNGDPVVSYNDFIAGTPCPSGSLITRTWLATDNCGNTGNCQQYLTIGPPFCNKLVSNINDSGVGSLRDCIGCAVSGDTIKFHTNMAGKTIGITSTKLLLNKNLFIRSSITPRIKITSSIAGLFDISAGNTIEFKDLDIVSGLSTTNNDGAAFNNLGILKLIGVKVFRNSSLPAGQYLIRDKPASSLSLSGACFIQYN